MQLKEVIQQTGLTEKAIKYYEKNGLIQVQRKPNHYRDYSEEQVQRLQLIQIYRKLNISVSTIKQMLKNQEEEKKILEVVLKERKEEHEKKVLQIQLLDQYLQGKNTLQELNSLMEFDTIAKGLQELLPYFYGQIFLYHFLPYLQISLVTEEQKKAYQNILAYFEQASLPFSLKFNHFFSWLFTPAAMKKISNEMDQQLLSLIEMSEADYEKLKQKVWQGYKHQQNPLYKYGPSGWMKRKMMKSLKRCGYYDIFLVNMEKLSPPYHEYRKKLFEVNQKICDDLHLTYDDHYQLVMKS